MFGYEGPWNTGSGKTTIRLQMMKAYEQHNKAAMKEGSGTKPYLVVDLSRAGHLTWCLESFKHNKHIREDQWDAKFVKQWSPDDMVDVILAATATELLKSFNGQQHRARLGLADNSFLCHPFPPKTLVY